MTTITDSINGPRSQFASNYRASTSDSIYGRSTQGPRFTANAINLQKLLSNLDKIEEALQGFRSVTGKAARTAATTQPAPATSAQLVSTAAINASTPTDAPENRVNPGNPFNGNGSNSPNFESGLTVGDGSFQINGVTISVTASSSIYSVLTTINASAANVTASYKSAEEKVVLTHNQLGAGTTIDLSNDSSGFLRAIKLSDSTIVQGIDAGTTNNTTVKSRSYRTANMLDDLNESLASMLESSSDYQSVVLKNEIHKIVDSVHADYGESQLKKSGITLGDAGDQLLVQNNSTRRRLVHALQNGDRFTLSALTGSKDGQPGLIPLLRNAILDHIGTANSGYTTGSITSLRA